MHPVHLMMFTVGMVYCCPASAMTAGTGSAPSTTTPSAKDLRADRFGHLLPKGALARLGSLDWRHGISLRDLALAPDGKTLVTVAQYSTTRWDGDEIRVWDYQTGSMIRSLSHRWTRRAVFSRDGSRLATCGGSHGSICFWNTEDGTCLWTYECERLNTPFGVAISPDGKQVLVGSRRLELLDAANGTLRRVIQQNEKTFHYGIAFSPDSRLIAAFEDFTARVWDADTGNLVRVMDGKGWGRTLVFSPDCTRLIAGIGQNVVIWETATGKRLQKLEGHTGEVVALAISSTGKYLATGSSYEVGRPPHVDNSIRIWDLETGKAVHVLPANSHAVRAVCFTPDDKTLISADASVRFWDVASGKQIRVRAGHEDRIVDLRFDRAGKKLVTLGLDYAARTWDAGTGKQLQVCLLGKGRLEHLTLSPAGTLAAGIARDGKEPTAFVFETATGKEVARFAAPDVESLGFSDLGDRLYFVGQSAGYFDFERKAVVQTAVKPGRWHAMVDPTGRFVSSANEADALVLDHFRWGSEYARLAIPFHTSTQHAFSPDGRTLLVQ